MKTLFRILVILVIAAIIGGMMYAAVSAMGSSAGGFDDRPEGNFRPELERGERPEDGLMLPFGVVKSLVVMSVIGAPYFLWRRRKK